ncbi:OB-fold domain-containing protein [Variovorax sp. J22R24]|uniref:Zn-ribbon domain-containing OB-fold protein n=1 Tax=Variovorax gracilis TaxID=3053502 RepID=UPI002577F746|nr:OB-fold domain-containing protein [Variovorax sp. J22R24]MDM0110365.1 OB-fold domain-containing protein [Variovorax sp. J22R24]
MSAQPYPLWSTDRELLASRDRSTGEWIFPAVADASPLAARHETVAIEGAGEVYSFTVIHPSAKSGQAPYALGYVDFPGPVRIFGRLQGREQPAIGDRYRPRADADFGYVFEAVEA